MVTAPFSDLLREPRFRGKRVRKLKVPWGEFQQQAKDALIKALTSPPILALPDWHKLFRLHTDASEIGAEAVLIQSSDHLEIFLSTPATNGLSPTQNKAATDQECLATLGAVDKFAAYVRANPFALITDCSALTWLF